MNRAHNIKILSLYEFNVLGLPTLSQNNELADDFNLFNCISVFYAYVRGWIISMRTIFLALVPQCARVTASLPLKYLVHSTIRKLVKCEIYLYITNINGIHGLKVTA